MTIVETTAGRVEGDVKDGVERFRGIPYAAPPVGERRFAPPAAPAPWADVRPARAFGPVAPQVPSALETAMGAAAPQWDEDCLYLNVWTPACDDGRRPVLVWIHGGGFVAGSGSVAWYDGSRFAQNGDVVVVTLNYRLGAFGFLHLGGVDGVGEDTAQSANAGILDQVAALRWVRDNIAAFGGDPGNVTVFGESAGGCSVAVLLGTPAGRGLFRRAIAQSGTAHWVIGPEEAAERTAHVLDALGGSRDVATLRAASAADLLAAQQHLASKLGLGGALALVPVVDGAALPVHPLDAVRDGAAAGVDLIVGTTRDEMNLFQMADPSVQGLDEHGLLGRAETIWTEPDLARQALATYRGNRPDALPKDVWSAITTDFVFRIPAIRLAEAQVPHGSVHAYWFTWASPAFGGFLGSCHALEVPFVFDNIHRRGVDLFTGSGEERRELADAIHRAWIGFARDGDPGRGDPGHGGTGPWPAYDTTRRATMRFDVPSGAVDDPLGDERALWDGIR